MDGEETGEKQLWEENWDDDNVEDDFSRQLRYEGSGFSAEHAVYVPTDHYSPQRGCVVRLGNFHE